ncbi:O-antigen ligase family protein [Anabaena sp. CCY 9910]|uniref:O-antigen ligase family protein n=1 Tax=Anabaena sp. CCY 9910 TaxID=3103870 RepID=UPI0039E155AC
MRNYQRSINFSALAIWLGVITIGLIAGFAAGASPVLPGLAVVSLVVLGFFFRNLEQAVLSALIIRSAIDGIVSPPLPSAFAIAIDILTLLYVVVLLFQKRTVHTDWFLWFFVAWVIFQTMWLVLLPIGGLGLDGAVFATSLREWVRLFSWLMLYLLVMQLKEKTHPQTVINLLFWALVIPLAIALLQMFVPGILPSQFAPLSGGVLAEGSRIRGSIGHPNSFATFLLLFIGLTTWKLTITKVRWPWLLLLGLLAFFYVSTKALFSLMMLAVFMLVLIAPRLSLLKLIGAAFFFGLVIFLFGSTEFGQQRLGSIAQTPLLNPDIDIWRAILLSYSDNNSFNWRIAQWHELLEAWKQYPLFGYGLGVTTHIASNGLYAHNDYVRALTEGGIVGLVSFIAFFGVQIGRIVQLMRRSLSNKTQSSLCLVLLALILTIPVGMITENVWSHTMLFFYWFTLLAVAGWDWNAEPTT